MGGPDFSEPFCPQPSLVPVSWGHRKHLSLFKQLFHENQKHSKRWKNSHSLTCRGRWKTSARETENRSDLNNCAVSKTDRGRGPVGNISSDHSEEDTLTTCGYSRLLIEGVVTCGTRSLAWHVAPQKQPSEVGVVVPLDRRGAGDPERRNHMGHHRVSPICLFIARPLSVTVFRHCLLSK